MEIQKSVYTFFEALAVCHTVQVAGSYEEDEDRAEEDEQQSLLNFSGEIPPIFHKSLEELNEMESVHEEIDFIAARQSVTFEHRNGNSKADDPRPFSDVVHTKKHDLTHRRPSSLSNIQFVNPATSLPSPESPPIKKVEFAKENILLRRVQQQQFKRTVSNNVDEKVTQKDVMTHRRTQSSVPFGNSGKFLEKLLSFKNY